MMDTEVNSVQAEAERLQKGWGQGVFSQAYQMLRKDREDKVREEQLARDAAVLSISFTKLSGGVVTIKADGRKVTQQTPLAVRKESTTEEVAFKSEVREIAAAAAGERRAGLHPSPSLCLGLSLSLRLCAEPLCMCLIVCIDVCGCCVVLVRVCLRACACGLACLRACALAGERGAHDGYW